MALNAQQQQQAQQLAGYGYTPQQVSDIMAKNAAADAPQVSATSGGQDRPADPAQDQLLRQAYARQLITSNPSAGDAPIDEGQYQQWLASTTPDQQQQAVQAATFVPDSSKNTQGNGFFSDMMGIGKSGFDAFVQALPGIAAVGTAGLAGPLIAGEIGAVGGGAAAGGELLAPGIIGADAGVGGGIALGGAIPGSTGELLASLGSEAGAVSTDVAAGGAAGGTGLTVPAATGAGLDGAAGTGLGAGVGGGGIGAGLQTSLGLGGTAAGLGLSSSAAGSGFDAGITAADPSLGANLNPVAAGLTSAGVNAGAQTALGAPASQVAGTVPGTVGTGSTLDPTGASPSTGLGQGTGGTGTTGTPSVGSPGTTGTPSGGSSGGTAGTGSGLNLNSLLGTSALIPGLALGASLLSGNKKQDTSNLSDVAGQLRTAGTSIGQTASDLIPTVQTGNLPAGAQTEVNNAVNDAKTSIRSHYAGLGLTGSTMEGQELAAADARAQAMAFDMANKLTQTGLTAAGVSTTDLADSATIYNQILQTQLSQDEALQKALADFASASAIGVGLASSGTGGSGGTNSSSVASGFGNFLKSLGIGGSAASTPTSGPAIDSSGNPISGASLDQNPNSAGVGAANDLTTASDTASLPQDAYASLLADLGL